MIAILTQSARATDLPGVLQSEFIYDSNPPTPSCHASTIAQTKEGLAASWFGGTAEGNKDVGIWVSLARDGKWSVPVEVANGVQPDGSRFPCWNPVLFQYPTGPLDLFYKIGKSPRDWWGMVIESADGGKTWASPQRLPPGILGPIKNKPVLLSDGTLLCPSSTEDAGWRAHIESTRDGGKTWSKTKPLNDPETFGLIQPTILDHGPAGLQILCRSKQKCIVEGWSQDGGKTWGAFAATSLPNPNSGIDAVMLKDGRSLLIYNDTPKGRSPLNVAVSADGKSWQAGPALETGPGEYSYPAVIQTTDGLVHVTYTWKRQRIKHVVLDPAKLELKDLPAGPRNR
jgi:predicted neuraminidase